jgi:hypothetical protein
MYCLHEWLFCKWRKLRRYIIHKACPSGCNKCSSATTCLLCTDTNKVGSLCTIDAYLCNATSTISGGSCVLCNTLFGSCYKCSSSSCTLCMDGYYLSGNNCLQCISGCSKCTDSSTCNYCTDITKTGNSCTNPAVICKADSYLKANGVCELCSIPFPNCLACSSSACTVCLNGYYLSSGACLRINIKLECLSALCQICVDGSTCSLCTSNANIGVNCDQPSSPCNANSYFDGVSCVLCTSLSAGCLVCTSNVCSLCDKSYILASGACQSKAIK